MNRKDIIPLILLVLLIPVWLFIDRTFIAPKFPAVPIPAGAPSPSSGGEETLHKAEPTKFAAEKTQESFITAPKDVLIREKTETLENEKIRIELTSNGGGIKSATLFDYPERNEKNSPPVVFNFSDTAALIYEGLAGIAGKDALNIRKSADGQSVLLSKNWNSGLIFERAVRLGEGYLLSVNDRFANHGSSPWNLPGIRIKTGSMTALEDVSAMKGVLVFGIDSHTPAGGVRYWGKKINGYYDKRPFFSSLFSGYKGPDSIDFTPAHIRHESVDWVAAKNTFFTQILSPEEPVAAFSILSERDVLKENLVLTNVAASLSFKPAIVDSGGVLERNYRFYIGPKKYSILKENGSKMEKVMEFETTGFFAFMNWLMEPSRKFLLWTMNRCHAVIPNYGIAIILMTLLIRILFWPLTHKSTESMKRLQEIQPQVKALQEKYRKDPQRLQKETIKLYREKKANPMGGCLPMFVQIPVFIALFTVLRNAIELRYSGFLWIADLSQPENLFAGAIPLIGSLNILPLLMTASMIWQQKLTSPSTAVSPEQRQQQKIMMFIMPVMMLFFFYTMPSGLVLYWTTSNLLMIAQTGIRNLRKKMKETS